MANIPLHKDSGLFVALTCERERWISKMRTVHYTLMPDVAGTFLQKEAPLSAFARDLSRVFIHKHIPPLHILNQAFSEGYSPREAEWEPFQLTESEYTELLDDLLSNPTEGFKRYPVPDYVESMSQWSNWLQSIGY